MNSSEKGRTVSVDTAWKDSVIVAFDAETDGAYPLGFDFCEIGAVKWKNGKIIDEYQTLIKPQKIMGDFVIGIHGITNEMVREAPRVDEVLPEFLKFIEGAVVIAHYATFDVGFLMADVEKLNLKMPENPILCSSLLSRSLIPESPDHKLQTLMKFLNLDSGQAHRALDDAKSCLQLGIKCFERAGNVSIKELQELQGVCLDWKNFSIQSLKSKIEGFFILLASIDEGVSCRIRYQGGSTPGKERAVRPIGIVRGPDKDFVLAHCSRSKKDKRFYLDKITAIFK